MSTLGAGHLINREMSRCQDVKAGGWPSHRPQDFKMSRCQDVKMSNLVAGHLIARKISRCQDVKMAGPGVCG